MDKIRYHMFPDTVKVANKVHVKTCYVVWKLKISISLSPIQICCFTSTLFLFMEIKYVIFQLFRVVIDSLIVTADKRKIKIS